MSNKTCRVLLGVVHSPRFYGEGNLSSVSDYVWVDTDLKLQAAERDIGRSSRIGIDTEYDSFRYFRDKLCLIQIRTDTTTYLFDPLNALDLSFLRTCFSNPAVPKILHAGDNDIRLLNRDYAFVFHAIFDTQKAASLLGHKHLSLTTVLQEVIGVELTKTKRIQRSQWDIRPLTEEQEQYAVQDIAYLFPLYDQLKRDLEDRGMLHKAEEAFREIATVRWSERIYDPYGYCRINGYRDLKRRQKERIRHLYEWRFKKAKAMNIAVFMVLSDQNLIDLAYAKVNSLADLQKSGHISEGRIRKYGTEIIALLKASPDHDTNAHG